MLVVEKVNQGVISYVLSQVLTGYAALLILPKTQLSSPHHMYLIHVSQSFESLKNKYAKDETLWKMNKKRASL